MGQLRPSRLLCDNSMGFKTHQEFFPAPVNKIYSRYQVPAVYCKFGYLSSGPHEILSAYLKTAYMRTLIVITLLFTVISFCAYSIGGKSHSAGPVSVATEDSLEKDRLKHMNEVMASIKGKEKWRADSVFRNLKVIIGESSVSAEHLLWMMNWGWSKELGVSCSHCHTIGKWESDSLEAKNIARGMWTMRVKINSEILPSITGRDYKTNPKVTCVTCHRGKPVPVTR